MKGLSEMQCSEAEKIYKSAMELNIAEDLILNLEGLSRDEYIEALKLYLKTLPQEEETTRGWEEDEPPKYECYAGRYIADSLLWR